MEFLSGLLRPFGPYSLMAFGAAFLGYGLMSGLLLIRGTGRAYVRPYFVSAFGMAIVCFVLAGFERTLLASPLALVKGALFLLLVGFGVALVRRARHRPLVRRGLRRFLTVGLVTLLLPVIPGVAGSIVNREEMLRAVARSSPEASAEILRQASTRIWTPLGTAALGFLFLAMSFSLILFRFARERAPGAALLALFVAAAMSSPLSLAATPLQTDPRAGCRVVAEGPPQVVFCPDRDAARAYAETHGTAPPNRPTPPPELRDPIPVRPGVALLRAVRRAFAPRARFVPVLFLETPPLSETQWQHFENNRGDYEHAQRYWANPARQDRAYRALSRQVGRQSKERFRSIVLRNGYFYTEDPQLARRIYRGVRLQHLFDEKEFWLQRGDHVVRIERRSRERFLYADGPWAGRRAVILPFDRVAPSREALGPAYHWDLQAVREALGLTTLQIADAAARAVEFSSHFLSGEAVAGFLYRHEGRTAAIAVAPDYDEWAQRYTENTRRWRARRRILDAAEAFIEEQIRFDEPHIEFGQEDGKLREVWLEAYLAGETTYDYNGMPYRVFDGRGTPIPPQVCSDFLMDSVERASGSWWRPRGGRRGRTEGTVRWSEFPGLHPRRIGSVIRFARDNPEIFEAFGVPKSREVPFKERERFFQNLERFPVDFREADMVMIWGFREDGRRHFHSVIVHETDPLDGFPIALSDNAGTARIRVWDDVMRTAPQRYVHYRVRVRDEWLLERGFGD
jgi:hypothetical protein